MKTKKKLNGINETPITWNDVKKSIREMSEGIKKLQQETGSMSNSLGKMIEHFLFDGLKQELEKINVKKLVLSREFQIETKNLHTEVDVFARGVLNGKDVAFIGECKSNMKKEDIKKFENNMPLISEAMRINDHQKYLVLGYNKIDSKAKEYAFSKNYICYRIGGKGNLTREYA